MQEVFEIKIIFYGGVHIQVQVCGFRASSRHRCAKAHGMIDIRVDLLSNTFTSKSYFIRI